MVMTLYIFIYIINELISIRDTKINQAIKEKWKLLIFYFQLSALLTLDFRPPGTKVEETEPSVLNTIFPITST